MIKYVKAYKSGRQNKSHYIVITESANGRRREHRYINDDLPQTVKNFISSHNFEHQGTGILFR